MQATTGDLSKLMFETAEMNDSYEIKRIQIEFQDVCKLGAYTIKNFTEHLQLRMSEDGLLRFCMDPIRVGDSIHIQVASRPEFFFEKCRQPVVKSPFRKQLSQAKYYLGDYDPYNRSRFRRLFKAFKHLTYATILYCFKRFR